jgi:hypothetical protein
MNDEKFCRQCDEKHRCSEIYQKIGNVKGPSPVREVLIAFLLPILVFAASFAAFDAIWAKIIETKKIRTALDFILALSATFALVAIIRVIRQSAIKTPKEKQQ